MLPLCQYVSPKIIEYWVVNLKKRQLIVFRKPSDGEYASKSTITQGIVYSLSFPDIAVWVNMNLSH
ncbi:MAG: Uma2 family endonuclease [Nostocales cyanobacterium 94392]|nr:Uma2 family endonuclease [Nostocales cyanobacterium 94392]